MDPDLRRHLFGRRLVVAAVIGLFTALFFGGMVGFAAAGEPSTTVPKEFGVPPILVGDRGLYNSTLVERTDDGFVPLAPERESVGFQWLPPRDMLDADGQPRRVNEMRHGMLSFYKTEDGFTSLENQKLREMGLGEVFSFDAETGRMIATGYRAEGDATHTWTTFLPADTTSSNQALCGLINPLQGQNHSADKRVELFSSCNTPSTGNLNAEFKVAGAERVGERDCVVYARSDRWGWVTGTEEVYVWMCPDVPYPIRMAIEDPEADERFVVYRLAGWTRGTSPLATGQSTPSLQPAPQIEWAPRTDVMFSEAGLKHPFPLSAAFSYALHHGKSASLRNFMTAHPGAYISEAHYEENRREATVDRYWWFVVSDQSSWASVGVIETESGGATSYRYENDTENAKMRLGSPSFVPPTWLPARLPTVASMFEVWESYRNQSMPDAGAGWSFAIRPEASFCGREPTPENCAASIQLLVGRRVWHTDAYPGDRVGGRDEQSVLTIWLKPESEEARIRGLNENSADFTWARPSRFTDLATFAFAVDVGVWRFPTGGYVIGAGLLAILVAGAYWGWPALKSAVGFGLFSRVEKPQALDHPARAQLAELIDANPGIHFQEIRRRLGWAPGLARHHLTKLVDLGLIHEQATAGYTCYFPQGRLDRRVIHGVPALKADGARRILEFILAHPAAASIDIARGTGLDPATVHYHVQRLVGVGLIETRSEGKELRATAAEHAPVALRIAG